MPGEQTFPVLPYPLPLQRLKADLALLLASVIWGSAFVAQRIVAPGTSILLFNGLRFLLAGALLLIVARLLNRKNFFKILASKTTGRGILIAGILLFGGASFQQFGLRYTTAGNAGFITGLYVVIIPLIQAAIIKRPPPLLIWIAAGCAAVGLFLLSTQGRWIIQFGDFLELIGAFFWSLHVLWIGQMAQTIPLLHLAIGQYIVCGVFSTCLGLVVEPGQLGSLNDAIWAILYTGIFSVAIGYTLQIVGQKVAPPADAAILMSMEAVFAALSGWLFLQETLSITQIIGCSIMLAGMLIAQGDMIRKYKSKAPG